MKNALKHLKGSFSLFQTVLTFIFTLALIIFYMKHLRSSCLKDSTKRRFVFHLISLNSSEVFIVLESPQKFSILEDIQFF